MSKPVRKSVRRPDGATLDLVRRIASHVEERTLDRIRGYLARGRPLAGLPAESLDVNWIETRRDPALSDEHREAELLDLRCEFDLRGLKPPLLPKATDQQRVD